MPEIILHGVVLTATIVWSAVGLTLWLRNSEDVLNQNKKVILFILAGPLVWLLAGLNGFMFLLDECRGILESWLRR